MSANQFGNHFNVTTFGESHGQALGAVIDGCPAGINFDLSLLKRELERRRPGQKTLSSTNDEITSSRNETDSIEILSGVFQEKTLGTPIAMIVRNQDHRSIDYDSIKLQHRPGHADDIWLKKFSHVDHRGGGRSSGRETVARVMAGAVAQMFVKSFHKNIQVIGYASQIGPLNLSSAENNFLEDPIENPQSLIDDFPARFPSQLNSDAVKNLLKTAKSQGQSYGGIASLVIKSCPDSLGQPVFHKFKSDLASALLGVGATAGIEFGESFNSVCTDGIAFHSKDQSVYGGIRGGITTGEDIRLRIVFKPTSSINDIAKRGRHDPCIVPRAIPVLEAMTWIVLADHLLWKRLDQ